MAHKLTDTEKPEFYLIKEYTTKPAIEDLGEVFVIGYVMESPNWKKDDDTDVRYIFFTDFAKAYKRFRLFVPGKAFIKRIFTDNEVLIKLGKDNDAKTAEVVEEETKEIVVGEESQKKEDTLDAEVNKIMEQVNAGKTSGNITL